MIGQEKGAEPGLKQSLQQGWIWEVLEECLDIPDWQPPAWVQLAGTSDRHLEENTEISTSEERVVLKSQSVVYVSTASIDIFA